MNGLYGSVATRVDAVGAVSAGGASRGADCAARLLMSDKNHVMNEKNAVPPTAYWAKNVQ